MTYSPKHLENFKAGSTWNLGTMSHRKVSKLEPTIKTLPDVGVDIDNVDSTEAQEDILALSAVQSANEFNDAYGDQQEQHFNELFRICWDQFASDEKTYEDWFKVFQANLLYPTVVNTLNSVKNIKAYRKGKSAIEELRNMPTLDISSDDGKSTRHVNISEVMRDNDEIFTDRFITKNSGILGELVTHADIDPVNVEEKLVEFVSQDGGTNVKQSLSQISGKGKNPIKAAKAHRNSGNTRSPLKTAQTNLRLISPDAWVIIVREFASEIAEAQTAIENS